MYDFKNDLINKILMVVGGFVAFIMFAAILPVIVEFIFTVVFLWTLSGLIGWTLGRNSGDIVDEEGVPFYKETKFYEYLAQGPVTLFKYLK